MLKKELSGTLNKVLMQDDVEWAGVKKCFNVFYEKIQEKLKEDEILSQNVEDHMSEIIDYIMMRVYK
jgi:hypothetical protein